jgi:hypothetical protein
MKSIGDLLTIPDPFPTKCFCWGSANGGSLGIDERGTIRKISQLPCEIYLPTNDPIARVSASDRRTIVTTFLGQCYSWGRPPLGRKTTTLKSEAAIKKIPLTFKVHKICQGETHGGALAVVNL